MSSQGAIIQYGTVTRPEHAVIYVSDDWKELLSLLESPCDFMRMKGYDNSPVAWSLLQGVTAIIEPMDITFETQVRSACLTEALMPPLSVPANWSALSPAQITPKLVPGSFIAEFAIYTRTLMIRYWRPAPANQIGGAFPYALQNPVTHAPVRDASGKVFPVGNLHVDIVKDPGKVEKHRAQFLIDLIEDPTRFTARINPGALAQQENLADLADLGAMKPPLPVHVPANAMLTFAPADNAIQIVVEGMSTPELPAGYCVCIDGDTRVVAGTIVIDGVLVKAYVCP